MQEINYLSFTEKASNYIINLIDNSSESIGIKIFLKRSGCSGLSYDIKHANHNNISEYDDYIDIKKNNFDTVRVYIDPKVSLFIINTIVDYVDNDTQNGLVFKNPNEKGRCGCGSSFYV